VSIDLGTRDGAVDIRVSDRGPGVPAGARERIFEPFERADAARKGTGLGLAVARRFVQAHGGDITVEDREGGGATFVVTLPVGG
jgi:two-component system sensor histidine kinase KdpD